MESPSLVRQGSAVPTSTHQVESTVLPIAIEKAWETFKHFKLEKMAPGKVTSTKFTVGAPNQLDSIVQINYSDGAKWEIRINGISDFNSSLNYQVILTEPAHVATSITGTIHLRSVTSDNTTYVEWITDFSNDADATVIYDQKFKKQEFFAEMKKTLAASK